MRIYEVRVYGGEYEDAFDDHVAAYMSKEAADKKAEELRQEMKKSQNQNRVCAGCPISCNSYDSFEEYDADRKKYKDYAPCVAAAPYEAFDQPWGRSYSCTCYDFDWDDRVDYYVKELEVIE